MRRNSRRGFLSFSPTFPLRGTRFSPTGAASLRLQRRPCHNTLPASPYFWPQVYNGRGPMQPRIEPGALGPWPQVLSWRDLASDLLPGLGRYHAPAGSAVFPRLTSSMRCVLFDGTTPERRLRAEQMPRWFVVRSYARCGFAVCASKRHRYPAAPHAAHMRGCGWSVPGDGVSVGWMLKNVGLSYAGLSPIDFTDALRLV